MDSNLTFKIPQWHCLLYFLKVEMEVAVEKVCSGATVLEGSKTSSLFNRTSTSTSWHPPYEDWQLQTMV